MRFRKLLIGSMMVATGIGPALASDWADDKDAAKDPQFGTSQAICRSLKAAKIPEGDAPDAAQAARLADCSSEALYYGIGRPIDAVAARQCAFVEKKAADPQVDDFGFTGDRSLMTIYANGVGAARNLDLATALACRDGFAPAETNGRVLHLTKLKAEHWTGTDFSLCDDITSGMMMGICADHDQLIARSKRKQALADLTSGWTPADLAALAVLQRSSAAFIDARGENEVDQSGTGRGAFVVAAEDKQEQAFLALLKSLAAGKLSAASADDAKAADAALNAKYADLMRKAPALFKDTTLTKTEVASTERAWLRYRGAWLAFAKAKFPATSPDMLLTRLTRDRTAQLGDVPASME